MATTPLAAKSTAKLPTASLGLLPESQDRYWWDRHPHNLEASVLGAILARPDVEATAIVDGLRDEAFSNPRLRDIFRAIRSLVADQIPPDPVAVTGRLRVQGALKDGDPLYLVELAASVASPSLLSSLVAKLREHARRQLLRDLAQALFDATKESRFDAGGLAALLRTVASDLDDDRPDIGLHDVSVFRGARRAARR